MPAHLIALARNIRDPQKYEEYTTRARALLAAAGAEPVAGGPVSETLAGTIHAAVAAVVRFPDARALEEWYRSDAYQALVPLRDAAADLTLLTIVGE